MSDDDKDIPVLDEVIFPGRPDQVKDNEPAAPTTPPPRPSAAPTLRERITAQQPLSEQQVSKPKPKQSNFEAMITRQIDAVLEKHMKAAREEIVRIVMLELRSRLPSGGKRPG